ncbi:MAG TPA: SGNH/GDSL hydrolase family protein, partial [Aeromicrobium sp.]|nr:SGNH/GDSL hydrolase family protein [Aeromicrobium sp.]
MTFRRSPWPLIASVGVTVAVGIGGLVAANGRAPEDPPHAQAPPAAAERYVAIGDSFTSGGPIGALQPGSGSCQRSSRNYPSLVAKELGFRLVDVSCGGATTQHVLAGSRAVPAAQVAAVNPETDVVTVSVGGNDLRIFADLLITCLRVSRANTDGAPCRDMAGDTVTQKVAEVKRRVGGVLDAIRERAPDAHVLVVTYLGL